MSPTSYTTILAMRCRDFVLIVGDGQVTTPALNMALEMDNEKTHSPYPRVYMGCSGSVLCRKDLESDLQRCSFLHCQTGEDVADVIVDHINDKHYAKWKADKIEMKILIVACIDEPRIFKIQKLDGADGSYYMNEEYEPIVAIGSSDELLTPWFEHFQENFNPQAAFEYAEKIVPIATKADWYTGGNLIFNTVHKTYQRNTKYHHDGALYHTHRVSLQQENPYDCRSPYSIRVDTWI